MPFEESGEALMDKERLDTEATARQQQRARVFGGTLPKTT